MINQAPANYSTETSMNSLKLDTRLFDLIVQETRNENREGERNHTYCAFIRKAQKYVAQIVQRRKKQHAMADRPNLAKKIRTTNFP